MQVTLTMTPAEFEEFQRLKDRAEQADRRCGAIIGEAQHLAHQVQLALIQTASGCQLESATNAEEALDAANDFLNDWPTGC